MRAHVRRTEGLAHEVEIRGHTIRADEPADAGGADTGPTPQELLAASLAACTAITMEMYAERKGWELGELAVTCAYEAPARGQATHFELTLHLPAACTEEQRERLAVIAGKCPVHRTLEGEVTFSQRVEG